MMIRKRNRLAHRHYCEFCGAVEPWQKLKYVVAERSFDDGSHVELIGRFCGHCRSGLVREGYSVDLVRR